MKILSTWLTCWRAAAPLAHCPHFWQGNSGIVSLSLGQQPGRWWNGPGVVGVGVRLPVHAALLPPLAPVEHPEVARRTQRRVRVVLALQTLVTRLIGKIFLYYTKIFLEYYSYYTCVMSPWATTPPCSSAAAASSEECAGTAAPITLPPVKLYHQSSLSPNPDPEYTQSRVIKVKC